MDYEQGTGEEPSNIVQFNATLEGRRGAGRGQADPPIEAVTSMIDDATRDLHAAASVMLRMIFLARHRCGLPHL